MTPNAFLIELETAAAASRLLHPGLSRLLTDGLEVFRLAHATGNLPREYDDPALARYAIRRWLIEGNRLPDNLVSRYVKPGDIDAVMAEVGRHPGLKAAPADPPPPAVALAAVPSLPLAPNRKQRRAQQRGSR